MGKKIIIIEDDGKTESGQRAGEWARKSTGDTGGFDPEEHDRLLEQSRRDEIGWD
jgi:hypothetical protein